MDEAAFFAFMTSKKRVLFLYIYLCGTHQLDFNVLIKTFLIIV